MGAGAPRWQWLMAVLQQQASSLFPGSAERINTVVLLVTKSLLLTRGLKRNKNINNNNNKEFGARNQGNFSRQSLWTPKLPPLATLKSSYMDLNND